MAEGGENCHHFSPLEEQLIREVEEEEATAEAQIQREKEMASQKLWCAFQDSATAVAHLFRGTAKCVSAIFPPKRCTCTSVILESVFCHKTLQL